MRVEYNRDNVIQIIDGKTTEINMITIRLYSH